MVEEFFFFINLSWVCRMSVRTRQLRKECFGVTSLPPYYIVPPCVRFQWWIYSFMSGSAWKVGCPVYIVIWQKVVDRCIMDVFSWQSGRLRTMLFHCESLMSSFTLALISRANGEFAALLLISGSLLTHRSCQKSIFSISSRINNKFFGIPFMFEHIPQHPRTVL